MSRPAAKQVPPELVQGFTLADEHGHAQARVQRILELRSKGYSVDAICEALNRNRTTLYRWLRVAGKSWKSSPQVKP